MSLSALLGPVTIPEVIAAFEEGRYLHAACGDSDRFASVFGWAEFLDILNLHQTSSPTLRVTKDGKRIPTCWLNGSWKGGELDGRAFQALTRQGVSVILNKIQQNSPALHRLWHQAETAFGSSDQLVAIANFGPGRAFRAHCDTVDMVIIQIAGIKEWELYGDLNNPDLVTTRITLNPGDILVLPYLMRHRCNIEDDSLQINILFARLHEQNYMKWLLGKVKKLPPARHLAPFDHHDQAALARHEAEVKQAVMALMDQFTPQAFLTEERRKTTSEVTLAHLPNKKKVPNRA